MKVSKVAYLPFPTTDAINQIAKILEESSPPAKRPTNIDAVPPNKALPNSNPVDR